MIDPNRQTNRVRISNDDTTLIPGFYHRLCNIALRSRNMTRLRWRVMTTTMLITNTLPLFWCTFLHAHRFLHVSMWTYMHIEETLLPRVMMGPARGGARYRGQ